MQLPEIVELRAAQHISRKILRKMGFNIYLKTDKCTIWRWVFGSLVMLCQANDGTIKLIKVGGITKPNIRFRKVQDNTPNQFTSNNSSNVTKSNFSKSIPKKVLYIKSLQKNLLVRLKNKRTIITDSNIKKECNKFFDSLTKPSKIQRIEITSNETRPVGLKRHIWKD